MSIIPKSWTGVDELRDLIWKLQQKVDLLEKMYAYVQQPRPVSVDPAGKIGHSTLPTPERVLDAAAVLADAIAKHDDKAPDVSTALEFYNAAGGYAWFRRNVTTQKSCVKLSHRSDWKHKQYQLTFGIYHKGLSKSKTFDTRREAEKFAFEVLSIHESECIKRKSPTDWWSRVKIFEEIKR